MWRSDEPSLKRCAWVLRRPLFITRMTLGANSLAFVTKDGEAFVATLPKQRHKDNVQGNIKGMKQTNYFDLPFLCSYYCTNNL